MNIYIHIGSSNMDWKNIQIQTRRYIELRKKNSQKKLPFEQWTVSMTETSSTPFIYHSRPLLIQNVRIYMGGLYIFQ